MRIKVTNGIPFDGGNAACAASDPIAPIRCCCDEVRERQVEKGKVEMRVLAWFSSVGKLLPGLEMVDFAGRAVEESKRSH